MTGRPHITGEAGRYFPGYPNLAPIKPREEDIVDYVTMRLKKDAEMDAMDGKLEADILRIIPDRILGSYVSSLASESRTIG